MFASSARTRCSWIGTRSSGRETARGSLCANLPYNIATPLVLDVLTRVPRVVRSVVMMQREVGERLAARPGDDALRRRQRPRRVPSDRVDAPSRPARGLLAAPEGGLGRGPARPPRRAAGRCRRGPPLAGPRRGVRAASEDDAERPPASGPRAGRGRCGARRERRRPVGASRGAVPGRLRPGRRRRCRA